MVRFARWLAKPKVQTWFNASMTVVWLAMLPITLIFIGPFSTVLWVSFISAWALFATHLGAWIAALVNVRAEQLQGHAEDTTHSHADLHKKLDHLIKHLAPESHSSDKESHGPGKASRSDFRQL